jgi:hypothetical protein
MKPQPEILKIRDALKAMVESGRASPGIWTVRNIQDVVRAIDAAGYAVVPKVATLAQERAGERSLLAALDSVVLSPKLVAAEIEMWELWATMVEAGKVKA